MANEKAPTAEAVEAAERLIFYPPGHARATTEHVSACRCCRVALALDAARKAGKVEGLRAAIAIAREVVARMLRLAKVAVVSGPSESMTIGLASHGAAKAVARLIDREATLQETL